jgi:hypothetical protein
VGAATDDRQGVLALHRTVGMGTVLRDEPERMEP